MAKIRGNPTEKWARRASQSAQDYAEGVANPRADWAASTIAAAAAQAAGVQAAIQGKRFEKGVQAAGSARWRDKATTKGVERFGPGVSNAQADYQKGVQPYLDTIANTTLPPRGPKGSPQNIQRVVAIAAALRAKKMAS